jgi:hypothetical protein
MSNYDFTLSDKVYRYALRVAAKSTDSIPGVKMILSGGAVIQLYLREKPELFRPTHDIDIVPSRALTEEERDFWRESLEGTLNRDGFSTHSEDDEFFPVKVNFEGLGSELYISLTKTYPDFHNQYAQRIRGEFQRAREMSYDGVNIPHQSLADILVGKLVRFWDYKKARTETDLVIQGFFDKLESSPETFSVSDRPDLDMLVRARNRRNIETLGEINRQNLFKAIGDYKSRKDMYDICCVFDHAQANGGFNLSDFKEAVSVAKKEFNP